MKARVNYLLRQYFDNTASRQELDDLFRIIQSAKYDEDIAVLIKELYEELKQQDPSLTYVDDNGRLLDISEAAVTEIGEPLGSNEKPIRRYWRISIGAAAAIAVLWLGFYAVRQWADTTPAQQEQVQVIKNAASDENKVIVLADGSKVWLNSSSRLEYPQEFKKGETREVTLIGEAYFEVEKAEEWPFVVHTGDVQTKVLGTKFNVKAYPQMTDVLVTVKSGKVMVSKKNKALATLIMNQELSVPVIEDLRVQPAKEKQLKNKVAGNWTEGYLEYEDETIASIIADLERFYKVSIQLEQEALREKIITLTVTKDSTPEYVIEILTTLTDTHFKIEENTYIIY